MPRKPKQQQLIVPPGADPSTYAGTPEAKAKMERVRAARATTAMQQAAEAMRPTQLPRLEANPMVIATGCLGALHDMAMILRQAGIAGGLQEVQVIALLLKGLELGIGPVEAVQKLYYTTDGKIETTAELIRALVLRHRVGRLTPITLTEQECVIEAVRYGVGGRPDTVQQYPYTMADAQRTGALEGDGAVMWRRHPRAMLLARATTEAGRAVFSDVLLGASFAAGELGGTYVAPADLAAAGPAEEEIPTPEPEPVEAPPLPEAEPTPEPEPAEPETPVDTPPEAPLAQPEPPVEAPEPPAPTPAPPPPAPVAQAASPAVAQESGNGLERGPRTFSHSFVVPAPGGGLRTVETCGITREQFSVIGDLTTPRAGQPHWEALKAHGRKFLQEMGLADLKELTEGEASHLIGYLTRQSDYVRPAHNKTQTVAAPSRQVLIEGVLRDSGCSELLPKVIQLVHQTFGTTDIDSIPRPDFDKSLAEIKTLSADPITFGLALEQVLAQP